MFQPEAGTGEPPDCIKGRGAGDRWLNDVFVDIRGFGSADQGAEEVWVLAGVVVCKNHRLKIKLYINLQLN